jgi:hypothetical protein
MRFAAPAFLATFLLIRAGHSDCIDTGDTAWIESAAKPAVLKLMILRAKSGCNTSGTAFFIGSDGEALTAAHLVPESCNDADIRGLLENAQSSIRFEVVKRSGLDVALLRPKDAIRSKFIPFDNSGESAENFRGKRVSIVSFYADYENITLSTARIDSVRLVGDPFKWGLCAVGANPSRSGSPVLLDTARVVAVFAEKPGAYNEQTGQRIDQDRGRIIPIRLIPDLPLPDQQKSDSSLQIVTSKAGIQRTPITYVYSIDLTADPREFTGDLDRAYLIKGGQVIKARDFIQVASELAAGAVLRFPQEFTPEFWAQPGYRFDPSLVRIVPDSHNPPQTPLPQDLCTAEHRDNCFEFSSDLLQLRPHIRLYAGSQPADRAHGWLHGGVLTRQTPRD